MQCSWLHAVVSSHNRVFDKVVNFISSSAWTTEPSEDRKTVNVLSLHCFLIQFFMNCHILFHDVLQSVPTFKKSFMYQKLCNSCRTKYCKGSNIYWLCLFFESFNVKDKRASLSPSMLESRVCPQSFSSRSRGGTVRWYFWTLWSELQRAATYRQSSLQLAGDGAEAVEHKVFPHTVDPLAAGRQSAAHEVTAFPLTGAETPHDLHRESPVYSNRHEACVLKGRHVGRSRFISKHL